MKYQNLILTTPYLNLDPIFYHEVRPTPLKNPALVSFNTDAAKTIGLDPAKLTTKELEELVNGTTLLEGSRPYAMCYAGHQFGYYVPRLGDGRAINLGRVNGWNLQLKGSGQTLYSRQGDGRAVLRSSIREYLMSEAMHALGIPTSRALALISSDEKVARERWEKGAIVLRMAPSWIRFGSFEYFFHTNQHDKLQKLADFCMVESFPQFLETKECYVKMFGEIVKR
ncbi:MAG: protein adenylyltransferase SelO family protein, partial [Sulfuricurvum sp.]